MVDGGWASIHEDITDRQCAENELQEQHRRFDAALANMSQGLLMFDADANVIVRNQRLLQIYGIHSDDVPLGAPHRQIVWHFVEIGIYKGFDAGRLIASTRALLTSAERAPVHRGLADVRTVAVSHRLDGEENCVAILAFKVAGKLSFRRAFDPIGHLPAERKSQRTISADARFVRRPVSGGFPSPNWRQLKFFAGIDCSIVAMSLHREVQSRR